MSKSNLVYRDRSLVPSAGNGSPYGGLALIGGMQLIFADEAGNELGQAPLRRGEDQNSPRIRALAPVETVKVQITPVSSALELVYGSQQVAVTSTPLAAR